MKIVASNSLTVSNVNDGTITHVAYANKSKDIFYDSLPSFANLPGYQGALVSSVHENGAYKITTTGGTHVMKTYVSINGTSGKALWSIVRLKNTHPTNNLRLVFNGIGDGTVLNNTFPTILIKPGEDYFFMKSGIARNNYDFIQITFQSDYADKDLAFNLYEASFYNSYPFVNFSFVPNNNDYLGNYTDALVSASTDITKYNWSLIRGNDGKDGKDGKDGTNGMDGNPGKIVSDTEPTTRFKGLTWKYSGTADLTASDGTVIKPNTEYYYNGTHWMINYLSANNIEANSITADLIDAKNLTITDGEFVSTTTNGPVTTSTEIKDNHIAISKTDGTVNTKNDLAVDTEQGFAMKFTNNITGLTREASVNFQGVSTSDSDGNYAQLTPQGTKLSTDVPWTDITRASGVGTSGTLRARINNGVFYAQSKDVTIPSIAPNSLITIGTMSSKFSGVSGFDALGLLYSPGQLSVASVTVSNSGDINIGNPNSTTMSGKVIQFSINIPLG